MTDGNNAIAIVDDEADMRAALRQMFEIENLKVIEFADAQSALALIDASFGGIVVSDLRMPGMDGGALFNRLRQIDPELPVIMMSGHGDVATAVDLVKRGAYDFLSKPFDGSALIAAVRRALEKRMLVLENRQLRNMPTSRDKEIILGESPQIEQFRETLGQLATADIDVLITGESGTGKSLAAETLHRRSARGRRAMINVDCGALQGEQAESMLFGHVSGAFAGAQFPRAGQILRADGSTLFLDHVDALAPELQTRLLQALEDQAVLSMGANQSQPCNFRSVSSSSADLDRQMETEKFGRSLYFRLAGYRLELPPLRARTGDAQLLFRIFLAEASAELNRDPPQLSSAIWRKLNDHDWPGNIRELRSFAASVAIGLDATPTPVASVQSAEAGGLKEMVATFEADIIRNTLIRNCGNIADSLASLGLSAILPQLPTALPRLGCRERHFMISLYGTE